MPLENCNYASYNFIPIISKISTEDNRATQFILKSKLLRSVWLTHTRTQFQNKTLILKIYSVNNRIFYLNSCPCYSRNAASAPHGITLEMQNVRPPTPTNWIRTCIFNKIPRWFTCTLKVWEAMLHRISKKQVSSINSRKGYIGTFGATNPLMYKKIATEYL